MDKSAIDRVFKFHPNTPDQDEDLEEVYRQAHRLAEAIRDRVSGKHAEQAIMQLLGVVGTCRNAIELEPRQAKPILVV